MNTPSSSHRLTTFYCWFMMVFLVLFPKGGIKLGGYPITWGYVFIAVTVIPLLIVRLLYFPLRFRALQLGVAVVLLPVQMLFVYTIVCYPTIGVGYAFAAFINLFVLPWLFLFLYPPFLPRVDGFKLARYFRICILAAALWGIFLFFWHPLTGHYIEIPLLTVNLDDYGDIEATKHIARGFFLKLISTYNNGNLYGVDTLMFLPLYELLEPVRWRKLSVKVALLLTLSRTVWVGLILYELLPFLAHMVRQAKNFPRFTFGKTAKTLLAVLVVVVLVFASLLFNGNKLNFLFDSSLGGRESLLAVPIPLIPMEGFSGFQEILYLSAGIQWGYVGMVAFTVFLLSPLWLLLLDKSPLQSPTRRAALKGLIIYMVMAGIDGGFSWIPTMAFFWFTYMIYIFGFPAAHARQPLSQEASTMIVLPSQA